LSTGRLEPSENTKKTCYHIMLRIIAAIVIMLNAVYYNNTYRVRFPTISLRSAVSATSSNVSESLRSGFARPLYRRPDNNNITILYSFLLFDSHSADRSNPFDRRRQAALVLRSVFEFSHGPSRYS
jgi:hypothetical protein